MLAVLPALWSPSKGAGAMSSSRTILCFSVSSRFASPRHIQKTFDELPLHVDELPLTLNKFTLPDMAPPYSLRNRKWSPSQLGKLIFESLTEVDDFLGDKFTEEQRDWAKSFVKDLYFGEYVSDFTFIFTPSSLFCVVV